MAIKKNRLSPILKWAGGKEQELKHIHSYLPQKINNYYEPFVGGGAVYFSIDANKIFINDKSHELIHLYNVIATQDARFFKIVEEIIQNWQILENIVTTNEAELVKIYKQFSENVTHDRELENWIVLFVSQHASAFIKMLSDNFNIETENFLKEVKKNLNNKIKNMKRIENKKGEMSNDDILNNIESALKSAFYMHFRHLYNNIEKYKIGHSDAIGIYFFIRNFAYSGMFRYNKNGEFNVPYGGIGYNRKNLTKKLAYLKTTDLVKHLKKTVIENLDFEDFFKKNKPQKDDFVFLDPPYDSEFSTYAQNEFTKHDQIRLADYLATCKANWMLVIKNTDFIWKLYNRSNIYITSFNKKYLVSFQNRNNKEAEHLLITNYKTKQHANLLHHKESSCQGY